jgi:hypothetical protein
MKMQTQHTPGPWYLDAHDEKGWFLLSESGPDIMAEPFDCSDSDARLISNAPDLLSTLEKLLSRAIKLDQSATHEGLKNCEAIAQAREAIRKAKGEA